MRVATIEALNVHIEAYSHITSTFIWNILLIMDHKKIGNTFVVYKLKNYICYGIAHVYLTTVHTCYIL